MTRYVRTPPGAAASRVEGDVHVRIWLGGRALDFCAKPSAALAFYREWRRKRSEAIEIVATPIRERPFPPRLPCEQLFAQPGSDTRHGR